MKSQRGLIVDTPKGLGMVMDHQMTVIQVFAVGQRFMPMRLSIGRSELAKAWQEGFDAHVKAAQGGSEPVNPYE